MNRRIMKNDKQLLAEAYAKIASAPRYEDFKAFLYSQIDGPNAEDIDETIDEIVGISTRDPQRAEKIFRDMWRGYLSEYNQDPNWTFDDWYESTINSIGMAEYLETED